MAMKSIAISFLITCHFLSLTSNCSHLHIRGLLYEEKTRLGSTPPSCHNKCNLCHPCMAVQVPTLPGHNRVKPGGNRVKPMDYYDEPPSGNMHSNYKPLGWKCRCGGHLYNP
ncbi:hypothetical protein QVD17_31669 [Tagetes erecta]|uniref:Epidermal patterning factor-like protein n=1 Tax=Tagetes erecta TaxID=13708 RepID=A0AAD8K6P3_TARER|nr:hypothetical protein QVD17_31669 [Tagetes erecta]